MNDGGTITQNIVSLAVIAGVGYMIYQKWKGKDIGLDLGESMDKFTKYHK